ncbi:hypothetical protein PYCCODRAFT_1443107 [Trametes coccinea BRFM310]|uniref:Uncharacterized protein n=1 Tax=Trametes coccinea (strain BRFM310) TaxID=1353009 RepID=A0A1Y2J0H4_TRAC3|nr:hypothetical protein PYCCODRAFT_1443107 [Trametes coccinea BRFM310]
MAESSSSSSGSASERYYTLKGSTHAHLDRLELSPETERYLDVLVDIADALGVDDLSFSTYSNAIERLDAEELAVTRSLLRAREAQDELEQHLLSTVHENALIDKWIQTSQSGPHDEESVASLQREKAARASKAKEYQKQLDMLMSDMPEAPPVSITELDALRKQLKKQDQVLKEKRAKVEAFQGLPPNIDLARLALVEASEKHLELVQIRERLLRKMAEGVN